MQLRVEKGAGGTGRRGRGRQGQMERVAITGVSLNGNGHLQSGGGHVQVRGGKGAGRTGRAESVR